MATIINPVPNINGTAKNVLMDQILAARAALRAAIRAMEDAAPNGRDYQIGGDLAASRAESDRRILAVMEIADLYGKDANQLADLDG